ncbi:MAG: hypothetical protein ACRC0L_04635, partial [Angustibacter sp.]
LTQVSARFAHAEQVHLKGAVNTAAVGALGLGAQPRPGTPRPGTPRPGTARAGRPAHRVEQGAPRTGRLVSAA